MNIYLAGSDGSGKSSLLTALKNELEQKGIMVSNVWIRSPKILSKPLMAYCRLRGYTKYYITDGIRYGNHNFSSSKFVSLLFPYLQYFDLRIVLWLKRIPRGVVFYDRFALDTLADIMVSTHRFDLHKKSIGKAFLRLLPPSVTILVVDVNEKIIRMRKPDTLHDPNLALKIKAYRILSKDLNIETLDNNSEFSSALEKLKNKYFSMDDRVA